MDIKKAIEHARDVAKEKYVEGMLCHANPNDEELDGCIECAREHEQLADWLEELKQYKQLGTLEEVRKAMEKQDAIDPEDEEYCPLCHTFLKDDEGVPGYYCPNCGQAIHWKEWCEE